ncbi:MAG: glycosyltransferase family 2 protein [bacterium]
MEAKATGGVEVSIVVPVYNERLSLEEVCSGIVSVLSDQGRGFEIIFVDDGSTDGSFEVLDSLASGDTRVRVIRLRRNFGQTAALRAGFDYSQGEIIVSMDADGQNDPADIPAMIEKLEEGYDLVNGWRATRRDNLITRKLPSRLGNSLIRLLTGVKLRDFGCTLKAYRREVIEELSLYGEMHRMSPVLAHLMGAAITELPVSHHPRQSGRSKYSILRAVSVVMDLITLKFFLGYFTRPLHIFGLMGLVTTILGGGSFLAVILMKLYQGINMTGNPILYLGVLCVVVGVQLIMLGLLGEVTIRTYFESQNKPIYMIKEIRESDQ